MVLGHVIQRTGTVDDEGLQNGEIKHLNLVLLADHPASARPEVIVPLVGRVFVKDDCGADADSDQREPARRFQDILPKGLGPVPCLLES